VDYHVGHGECVIGVEGNDAGIPANRCGDNDDIFPGIDLAFNEPSIRRSADVGSKCEPLDRLEKVLELKQSRQACKVIFQKP
jgi:hypothetical protein